MIAKDIGRLITEGEPLLLAVRAGVRQAVDQHRREGRPLVVWRNDRVAWIDPFTFEEVSRPEDGG